MGHRAAAAGLAPAGPAPGPHPRLPAGGRGRGPARPPAHRLPLRQRALAQGRARLALGGTAVGGRLRRRPAAALCLAAGAGRVAAARPLQVAQQPRPALCLGRHPRPQGPRHPQGLRRLAAPGLPGPRRRRQPARTPGRQRPQARLRRQRGPEIRPARGHRTAGQRGRRPTAPAGRRGQEGLFQRQGPARRRRPEPGMPAPGLSAAVPLLHRGPPRAGLRAHPEERDLPQGLQPGEPARPGAPAPAQPAGPGGQVLRYHPAPPVQTGRRGLRPGGPARPAGPDPGRPRHLRPGPVG